MLRDAVSRLKEDIVSLGESEHHAAFLVAVNTDTAKVDLVPIPTIDNMTRLKEHLEEFPEGVRNAIKKSVTESQVLAKSRRYRWTSYLVSADEYTVVIWRVMD